MGRRTTRAQQAAEWSAAKRRAWDDFRPRLASLATVEDAHRLMEDCPAPDTPARAYFSNFAFFLSNLVPPGGANASELMLYADFIDRLVQAGQLAADRGAEVNEKLRSAIGSALLR